MVFKVASPAAATAAAVNANCEFYEVSDLFPRVIDIQHRPRGLVEIVQASPYTHRLGCQLVNFVGFSLPLSTQN